MKRRGPRAKKPSAKNVHGSAGERQRNDEAAPAVIPHEVEASIEVPKNRKKSERAEPAKRAWLRRRATEKRRRNGRS